jgi:hypothetical protein
MHRFAAAALAALPAIVAAQDYCALVEKRGPEVFGTKLQAAPLRDPTGNCAANNADGSGRLTVGALRMAGTEAIVASKRKDVRQGESSAEEPKLGKGAASIRTEKGRQIEFLVPLPDRLLMVVRRERDGLTEAHIERTRAFAAAARDLR